MDKPIAYFGYSKEGLTIEFVNNSLNKPTAWSWDFGDGSTSSLESPSHNYDEEGLFVVKLVVTNEAGASEPFEMNINVGQDETKIDISLLELVDQYLPSAVRGELGMKEKIAIIQNYQKYLQPLVVIPFEVLPKDTHNEKKWPGMVNFLIAQMVSLEVIIQGANQFVSLATKEAGSESESGSENTTGGEQQIKSIETGPTKTEWYEDDGGLKESEKLKNLGAAYSSATKVGGAIDQLKVLICQQSQRLKIYLPMCGPLSKNTISPKVSKKTQGLHNANPFGITKRMT